MFKLTIFSLLLLVTSAFNLALFATALGRTRSPAGRYFALAMLGIFIWSFGAAMDYAAVPLALKIFFAKIEAAGYLSAIPLFTLASVFLARRESWLKRGWFTAPFFIVPLSFTLLAWSNELHGWIWAGFAPKPNNVYAFRPGPAYPWMMTVYYAMLALIFFNLWTAWRKGLGLAKRQLRLMMFATLFPLAANLVYQLGGEDLAGIDWTSITFSVSAGIFLYALRGARFLDVLPIVRDQLFESLSDGILVLDEKNRVMDVNPAAARMFDDIEVGQDAGQALPPLRALLNAPPARESGADIFFGEGKPPRYVNVVVCPVYKGADELVGKILILRDVSLRKEKENRLLQLEQAVEQSPVSVAITDLDGNLIYVNPGFTQLSGYSMEELVGKNMSVVQSGQTPVETYQDLWQTIKSGRTWRGELLNKKKNGELYWESEIIAPVFNAEGEIINYIAVKEDITERKRAERALQVANLQMAERLETVGALRAEAQEQAFRDALTGLYNRRFLEEVVGRGFGEAEREAQPLSVILLDIDHLKYITDAHGHAAGDAYLALLANLLAKNARKSDMVFRYGGEEFLLLLPETTSGEAAQYAERLRALCARTPLRFEGGEIQTTVSMGVAAYPEHGARYGEVIGKADQALYQSKKRGRNRVTVYAETMQPPR